MTLHLSAVDLTVTRQGALGCVAVLSFTPVRYHSLDHAHLCTHAYAEAAVHVACCEHIRVAARVMLRSVETQPYLQPVKVAS